MGHNGRLLAQLHGTFTPAWFSHGHARCLRRFERSDYDGKGVSLSCLHVVARKLPHLLYGPVFFAPLFPQGKASWRTSRPARHRQNVYVLPYDAEMWKGSKKRFPLPWPGRYFKSTTMA